MRKLQKYLCGILLLMLCCGMSVQAKEKTEIQLGSAEGAAGETIEIPIDITNAEKVSGLDLTIRYDPTELKYIDATASELTKGATLFDVNHLPDEALIKYLYANLDGMGGDGRLVTFKFEVLKDTEEAHKLDAIVYTMSDADRNAIAHEVKGGRFIKATTGNSQTQTETVTGDAETSGEAEDGSQTDETESNKGGTDTAQSKVADKVRENAVGKLQDEVGIEADADGKESDDSKVMIIAGGAILAVILIVLAVWFIKRKGKSKGEEM